MPHLRVSLAFTHDTDTNLHSRATAVSAGFFGNAAYPDHGMIKADFDAANKAFDDAIPIAKAGGPEQTAAKNSRREELIALLRQAAAYVQLKHGDDLEVLLSSGFEAIATAHAPATMTKPHIREIINGVSGELITRVDAQANVRLFRARYAAIGAGGTPGPSQDGGLHGDSRHISIKNLTPGTLYSIQVQAVAGAEKISDWSDPEQHMCM